MAAKKKKKTTKRTGNGGGDVKKIYYWTVLVQFESGYKTKICGTAPTGEAAQSGALAICEEEWNQDVETIQVTGLTQGGQVNFTSTGTAVKILRGF